MISSFVYIGFAALLAFLMGFFGKNLKYPLTLLIALLVSFLVYENNFGNNIRSIILAAVTGIVLMVLSIIFKRISNIVISVLAGLAFGYMLADTLGLSFGEFFFWLAFIGPAIAMGVISYVTDEIGIQIGTAVCGGMLLAEFAIYVVYNINRLLGGMRGNWLSIVQDINSGALFSHLTRTNPKLTFIIAGIAAALGLLIQLAINYKKKPRAKAKE